MELDEYDDLDKTAQEKDEKRSSSRRHREHDKDAKTDGGREHREDRDRDRGRERSSSKSDRMEKDKDRERLKDRDKERERIRDGAREKERDRSRKHDREDENEVEKERSRRSSSKSRRHDRDADVEYERERSRRSGSRSRRHDREVEIEMERARSRERAAREKDAERETREGRKSKEKKEVEPEADPERDQRTVFAYQMPLKATERDVYEFFSQVGKVRDVRLIMDRNSRRSKGVGYIEFYDVMSVQAALQLSGQLLLGQPVMVKRSEAEKNLVQSTAGGTGLSAPGADRKLYVGNLHFNMTEEQLRQIFEAFGPVELVQLPLDMETGQCKGFGFVQFGQLEHAKAAQQSLNGTLEIAGRIVKVSAVTEHVAVQDTGANATDFDDDDGGGLALNARSRAILMQKLDRTGTASSIAESLGVPLLNGANPTSHAFSLSNGKAVVPMAHPTMLPAPVAEPVGDLSDCVLLKNMFDPSTEMEPDFDLDIKEDVQEECSKFGIVKHIFVDKNSSGHVYLRFDSVAAAARCQRAMHMRWFARRCISALFMRSQEYEAKFRSAV